MQKFNLLLLLIAFSATTLLSQSEGKNVVIDFVKTTKTQAAKISKTASGKVITLSSIKMPLTKPDPFITFSVRLEGVNLDHENVELSMVEDGGKTWQVIHANHEAASTSSRFVTELLYLDKNLKNVSLKIELKNSKAKLKSAHIRFFSPGNVSTGDVSPKESLLACDRPPVVSRSVWGAAQGLTDERIFNGTPTITTVTHLIVHHSAGSNTSTNWAATMLSIFDYHVNTNGWSDVGYNYLVAPTGQIFVGRGGGDNVMGAHFCGYNGGTMGVCLMGNFMTVAPPDTMLGSLSKILAWKAVQRSINPTGNSYHTSSARNLNHIAGHRDGCATSCPGDLTYPLLPNIRQRVANLVNSACATSNREVAGLGNLRVFPNPSADGRFSVELNLEKMTPSVWTVFDALGRAVFNKRIENQTNQTVETIDLKAASKGVYFLKIAINEQFLTEKIVVE